MFCLQLPFLHSGNFFSKVFGITFTSTVNVTSWRGWCVWLKKLKPHSQVFPGRLLYHGYFPGPVGTETFGMLISGCLAVPYFKTRICEQFRIKLWYLKLDKILQNNKNDLFSRDQIENQIKKGYYVINLDDQIRPETHWVAMNIKHYFKNMSS